MKIDELSKTTGFAKSTIYEYLKLGILHPANKQGPTKSFFDDSHIERLELIKKLKHKDKLSKQDLIKRFSNFQNIPEEIKSGNVKIQIIDKALKLFSEKGYENTKITEITDALNMGSGSFYRFFSSKEELLIACMERLPKVLIPKQAWAKVVKEKNYIKRLRNRGYAMMNAFPSYIGILNHIRLLLDNEDKNISQKAAECLNNIIHPLKEELQFAIKHGKVREVDVDFVSYILLGINSIYADRMLIDSKYSVDEAFAIIEDFVYHAIVKQNKEPKDKWDNIRLDILNEDSIRVSDLKFNGSKYLYGFYKKGEISFHINNIKEIVVLENTGNIKISLKDINLNDYIIMMDVDTKVYCKISKAGYKVKLENIKKIYFEE